LLFLFFFFCFFVCEIFVFFVVFLFVFGCGVVIVSFVIRTAVVHTLPSRKLSQTIPSGVFVRLRVKIVAQQNQTVFFSAAAHQRTEKTTNNNEALLKSPKRSIND
jgi:hypothetical protein